MGKALEPYEDQWRLVMGEFSIEPTFSEHSAGRLGQRAN